MKKNHLWLHETVKWYVFGQAIGAFLLALTLAEGYCWATNSYLAELFDLSAHTISGLIKQLKDCGHIQVEVERDPETDEQAVARSKKSDAARGKEEPNSDWADIWDIRANMQIAIFYALCAYTLLDA